MVTVQIASIPNRIELLRRTVESLKNQVDFIHVGLNNYDQIPDFLNRNWKITGTLLDNSTGDAAKFYGVEDLEGYIFTCDDDLIYPKDYVKRMIDKIEQYKRKTIITNHGRIMFPRPVESYYRDKIITYHCLLNVSKDHKVDCGGTGVMAFHSDTIKLKYSYFKSPNMADIWVAIYARKRGVPIIVQSHEEDWIQYQDTNDQTIWDQHYLNDAIQTALINKYF